MKQGIHPQYHTEAEVTCACGAKHIIASNKPKFTVEVCSACHPFYTGKSKTLDTTGRVDRFKKRVAAGAAKVVKKTAKKK